MGAAGRLDRVVRPPLAAALAAGAILAAGPAQARVIDEAWFGAFAHNVAGGPESDTADFILEVDSAKPRALRAIGAPRLNLTLSANSAGRTNLAGLGFVWDRRLTERLRATLDFGLAYSDGLVEPRPGAQGKVDRRERLLLGSHVLFREAVGLDWRLSGRWSLGVEYVHASNGEILGSHPYNSGVNQAGLRLGYRFD